MLDDGAILNIVGQELSQSAGGNENEFIDSNRKAALAYYLGQKLGNEVDGRSQVVSTDIADAIEWILPEVMEQLSKSDEIVVFDALNQEDEDQAMMESKFVYDILMKQNNGFLILHQVVKDALMQKNGIIKTCFEREEKIEVKRYSGLTEEEMGYILNQPNAELAEHTAVFDEQATDTLRDQHRQMVAQLMQQYKMQMQQYQQQVEQIKQSENMNNLAAIEAAEEPRGPEQVMAQMQNPQAGLMSPQAGFQGEMPQEPQEPMIPPEPEPVIAHDIMVRYVTNKDNIKVRAVPPEEFRINRQHNTPDPREARFTAHVVLKSTSELILSGIPREVVDKLPRSEIHDDDRDYRFYMQNETVYPTREVSNDPSTNLIEVSECFLHIDIDEDGIAEFMKIEVAGGDNPTHILRMEQLSIDDHPFTSAIAILMSHKFFGLSIYDRLKQLQDQKTSLWRNILDNVYLQNNQRFLVMEGQVNLDDMLISRPGGIVRQRAPGSVEPIVTPSIGEDAYRMMEYLDQVRAGRVGVNPEGPLNIQDIGDRVGSEGVAKLLAAREAVVGLIVRVIAETGVKPLMLHIRNLARRHLGTAHEYKFRESWRTIRPTNWPARDNVTVRVGTGSGNNAYQLQAVSQVLELQTMLEQNPGQTLVGPQQRFNAIKKFCNLAGLGDAAAYILDPRSDEGNQMAQNVQQAQQEAKQKEDEMNQNMMQMQTKLSDAEMGRAQAELMTAQLRGEIGQLEGQIKQYKNQIDEAKESANILFQYDKLRSDEAIKLTELEVKQKIEASKIHAQNKQGITVDGSGSAGQDKRKVAG